MVFFLFSQHKERSDLSYDMEEPPGPAACEAGINEGLKTIFNLLQGRKGLFRRICPHSIYHPSLGAVILPGC